MIISIHGRSAMAVRSLCCALVGIFLASCGSDGRDQVDGFSDPAPLVDPMYQVGGTISAAANNAVDSDVNLPLPTSVSNHPIANAQLLQAPVTLGGYAGLIDASSNNDDSDYFLTATTSSLTIQLEIADAAVDLDLFLYDENQQLLDASMGSTSVETLSIAGTGESQTFYIQVLANNASARGSNYVLSINRDIRNSRQATVAGQHGWRLSSAFVDNEVLVQGAVNVLETHQLATHQPQLAEQLNSRLIQTASHGLQRWQLGNQDAMTTIRAAWLNPQANSVSTSGPWQCESHNLCQKLAQLAAIKALNEHPEIDFAEPNWWRYPTVVEPVDEFLSLQWHYDAISLSETWSALSDNPGSDVIVAVIDTGVLLNHPDLNDQLVGGYDFISEESNSRDGDGVIDSDPNDPGDKAPDDINTSSSFHGTHVAGTIAAEATLSGNGSGKGVVGIAWGAKIMPMRALGLEGGASFDIQQALLFAAGLTNDSGTLPAKKADIINMSFGGPGSSQSEQLVIDQVRDNGVILIGAAGNESTSEVFFPAGYDGVVAVSALTIETELAEYSNYGSWVDVAAPGGALITDLNGDGQPDGVLSTIGDDSSTSSVRYTYAYSVGTSMAAPHVAGVAAIMKQVNPNLTPAQFDSLLSGGQLTVDIGDAGFDEQFGYGQIHALKALSAAGGLDDAGPFVIVEPAVLNFGANSDELSLSITQAAAEPALSILLTSTVAWLDIDSTSVDDNGAGSYTISVQRAGLQAGSYVGTINVISANAATVAVPISMTVLNVDGSADAGFHFVLLLQEVDGVLQAVQQVELSASAGEYHYLFDNVEPGIYQIVAGTDNDNDNEICDAGEACGGYPSVNRRTEITVNTDRDNLNFSSGFLSTLISDQAASAVSAESNSVANTPLPRIREN